ncbi:MAG: hypothetical protein ACRDN0_40350, partial [Trebonia sp.]
YNSAVVRAALKAGAFFSVTAAMNTHVKNAIAAIPEDARTPIRYPRAVWDEQAGGWVSDAEVTEIGPACGQKPPPASTAAPGRPPQRPDQPRPARTPHARQGTPPPDPDPETRTSR